MLALTLLVSSLGAQIPPQPGIPAGIVGLPTFAAVPYTPGLSFGPDATFEPFPVEPDTIDLARRFWTFVDTGDPDELSSFEWSAEAQAMMAPSVPGGPGVQFDPWAGAFDLFEFVYQHRLPQAGDASEPPIAALFESDVLVATTFKHWSLTRQLVTSPVWDPVAHERHLQLVIDGLFLQSHATARGVPLLLPDLLVSDRLEIVDWTFAAWNRDSGAAAGPPSDPQACIDGLKAKLAGFEGLYTADDAPCFFGLFGGAPGFDCDDFADAIGAYIVKKCRSGLTSASVVCSFIAVDPANGKKRGRVHHDVTMIKGDAGYWLVDAQTGASSGPHSHDTPPDAAPILGGYNVARGSVKTSKEPLAPNDRSGWYGEPPPWHESRAMVEHFENVTGLDADCFVQ